MNAALAQAVPHSAALVDRLVCAFLEGIHSASALDEARAVIARAEVRNILRDRPVSFTGLFEETLEELLKRFPGIIERGEADRLSADLTRELWEHLFAEAAPCEKWASAAPFRSFARSRMDAICEAVRPFVQLTSVELDTYHLPRLLADPRSLDVLVLAELQDAGSDELDPSDPRPLIHAEAMVLARSIEGQLEAEADELSASVRFTNLYESLRAYLRRASGVFA
ncbi:MAG: hypothetical protein WAJ85_01660 [Candidatus Baltobacteraceae bacterium]